MAPGERPPPAKQALQGPATLTGTPLVCPAAPLGAPCWPYTCGGSNRIPPSPSFWNLGLTLTPCPVLVG